MNVFEIKKMIILINDFGKAKKMVIAWSKIRVFHDNLNFWNISKLSKIIYPEISQHKYIRISEHQNFIKRQLMKSWKKRKMNVFLLDSSNSHILGKNKKRLSFEWEKIKDSDYFVLTTYGRFSTFPLWNREGVDYFAENDFFNVRYAKNEQSHFCNFKFVPNLWRYDIFCFISCL